MGLGAALRLRSGQACKPRLWSERLWDKKESLTPVDISRLPLMPMPKGLQASDMKVIGYEA